LVTVAALLLLVVAGGFWAYSTFRQGQQLSVAPKSVPAAAAPAPVDAKNNAAPAAKPQGAAPEPKQAALPPAAEAAPVPVAPVSDLNRLMRAAEASSDQCGGGAGDLDEIGRACAERDRLIEVLANRGWCFGKRSVAASEKSWQRCAQ
jgi:hypothetical protein